MPSFKPGDQVLYVGSNLGVKAEVIGPPKNFVEVRFRDKSTCMVWTGNLRPVSSTG